MMRRSKLAKGEDWCQGDSVKDKSMCQDPEVGRSMAN